MKRNFKLGLIIASLICTLQETSRAQYTPEYVEHLMLKYPDSDQVMCNMEKTYTLKKGKNGKLDIQYHILQDKLITKSGTFKLQSEELRSDSSYMELVDFDAYSLVPVNGKYQKKSVKEFFKSDDFRSSFFTDDSKKTQFYFPNTQSRTITHLDYLLSLNDEFIIPNTFVGSFYPIENFTLKVVADNDIDLDFHFFHVNNDTLNYTRTVGKKTTEHVWIFKHIPKTKYFGDAPDIRWYLPHISFNIMGYRTDDGYKKVLTELEDLYTLYQKWISMIPDEDTTKLQKIVDDLKLDGLSEYQKLKKIYNWVQANVKYIAYTDGMEGFVPRSGTDVLNCRYGDCKGMSNLIHGLSNAAGVKTYRTWIGSRDIPYRYDEVHTPLVDNHMIVTYLDEDSAIFMDATDSYLPFGYPTRFIQGKQALVGVDDKKYELKEVPTPGVNKNQWVDTIWVKIDGANISGKGKIYMSGYHASRWRHEIQNLDKKEILEFASGYLMKGDNRFSVTNINIGSKENAVETNLEYDFAIRNYVTTTNENLYINLNLETGFAESQIEEDRTTPIELSYFSLMRSVVNLEIPDSYKVDHIPENASHNTNEFGYSIEYLDQSQQVVYTIETYSKSLMMNPEMFDGWNSLSKQFRKDVRTNLVLSKKP